MVSSGYGTEATVESIWAVAWDTTQFGNINVVIGTMFNFWITGDGGTDITETKITTMLAAETHILFAYWNAMVKESAITNPWEFINQWIQVHLSGDKFYQHYANLIEECKLINNNRETLDIASLSGFGASNDL